MDQVDGKNDTIMVYCVFKVHVSLAGQPLRKREEGSGVMPISDLYHCSQECSPIRSLHVTTNIAWLLVCRPTNQRPALLVQ